MTSSRWHAHGNAYLVVEDTLIGACLRSGFRPAVRYVVQEWTATGTHAESGRTATWDGMDILPTRGGRFARKDVYSDSVSVLRQLGRIG